MDRSNHTKPYSLLLLVAGAKGAVGSTLAVALAAMQKNPASILSSLTTGHMFADSGLAETINLAGWDVDSNSMTKTIQRHGVIPENIWKPHTEALDRVPVFEAPETGKDFQSQTEQLADDIAEFKSRYPDAKMVFVNMLPAAAYLDIEDCRSLSQLYSKADSTTLPDLAYALAAIAAGIPVVNFTPNIIEIPLLLEEAQKKRIPIAGRDGKTGQTYLKVVLASALKARNLLVDGWYSLNILGNADGANLMEPDRAAEKLSNKTNLLDDILEYKVGENYGVPAHKVHIDYYPPRGDAKEAWDTIDFKGLFGLPMSLRLNLLGRDSVLAAPLVIDLARWMVALQMAGRCGPVPELGFYFKRAVGDSPPVTFQDQVTSLTKLANECEEKIAGGKA